MPIEYLKGDATIPQGKGPKIIAHICNNQGGWGAGFVLAVSRRWKEPEIQYRNWFQSKSHFALGEIQCVKVGPELWVANMLAQKGYLSEESEDIPLQYEALALCLIKLRQEALTWKASVHMPRIGTGLAGGKWDRIEPLINRLLPNTDIYVYDLA